MPEDSFQLDSFEPDPPSPQGEMVMAEPQGTATSRFFGRILSKGKEIGMGILESVPPVGALRSIQQIPEGFRKGKEELEMLREGNLSGLLHKKAAEQADVLSGGFGVNPEAVRSMAREGNIAGLAAEGVVAAGAVLAGGKLAPKTNRVQVSNLMSVSGVDRKTAASVIGVIREAVEESGVKASRVLDTPGSALGITAQKRLPTTTLPEAVNAALAKVDAPFRADLLSVANERVSGAPVAAAIRKKITSGMEKLRPEEAAALEESAKLWEQEFTIGELNAERVALNADLSALYNKRSVPLSAELAKSNAIKAAAKTARDEVARMVYSEIEKRTGRDFTATKLKERNLVRIKDGLEKELAKIEKKQADAESITTLERVEGSLSSAVAMGNPNVTANRLLWRSLPEQQFQRRSATAMAEGAATPGMQALLRLLGGRVARGGGGGGGF